LHPTCDHVERETSMTQETDMSSTRQGLIAVFAIASAATLSTDPAEAWDGYYASYYGGPFAYRPLYPFAYQPYGANFTYRPPYAYRSYYGFLPAHTYRPYMAYAYTPLDHGAYSTFYYPASTGYFGSGTFSDGRRIPGTNYNPNQ
jgi:hypothetical protein